MDDMQRQLDGDLDERESDILMAHLQNCPECSEMFDRLQRLSQELEQLPKVMPPFSLVDAIMPKLAEIDAAAVGTGTSVTRNVAGLRRNYGSALTLPTSEAEHRRASDDAGETLAGRSSRLEKRRKRRFTFGALGGIVAAAVVAGLFLVTYQPNMISSGNQAADALPSSGSAAESSASGDFSASTKASSSESKESDNSQRSTAAQESEQNQKMDSSENPEASADGSSTEKQAPALGDDYVVPQQSNQGESSGDPDKTFSAPDEKSSLPSNGSMDGPDSGSEESSTSDSSADGTNSGSAGAAEAPGGDSPDLKDGIAGGNPESGAAGGTDGSSPAHPGIAGTPGQETGPNMGIAASPEAMVSPSDTSPDGTFKAAVKDGVVSVYKAEGGGGVVFESDPKKGTIGNLAWIDNKTLTYTVTNGEDSKVTYKVDVEAGSESQQ
ncbi:zf-HC2 domain-containing protein [Paenibacillus beijingensis]|nr:zf-HC2 domain-containing protein [Paenibacillus beijingensis]